MSNENQTNRNSIFETKEQYFKFRDHWKSLFRNNRHREWIMEPQLIWGSAVPVGFHRRSPVLAIHHLVFCIATGKDPMKMFRNYRKPNVQWADSPLYWRLFYQNHTTDAELFSVFGDTLTGDQKAVLNERVVEFYNSIRK